jgi:hypothetical protein
MLGGRHTEEQARDLRKELDALTTQYQELEANIRVSSPKYAALTQPIPIAAKEIMRDILDSKTLLLEYWLGPESSYVWAVTSEGLAAYGLPGRGAIEQAARRMYDLTVRVGAPRIGRTGHSPRLSGMDAEYNEAAMTLSRMVLGPVATHLGKERLLVVGDGALNYVPFPALPEPRSEPEHRRLSGQRQRSSIDNPGPLVLGHEVVCLPSTSVLAELRRQFGGRKAAPKPVAIFADPVFDQDDARVKSRRRDVPEDGRRSSSSMGYGASGSTRSVDQSLLLRSMKDVGTEGLYLPRLLFSRQEAESIAAIVGPASKKALDFEASRRMVENSETGQYRIIHFATHSLLDNEHPELSGLVLSLVDSEGNPQNGFERLLDIFNMNLGADLVVLSACQTALGKQTAGEGIIGLTRGFMYAGAPSVIASLWNVNDEATGELMKRLYTGIIKNGWTAPAALRAAQIEMLHQKRWAHPFYWAGFTVYGAFATAHGVSETTSRGFTGDGSRRDH